MATATGIIKGVLYFIFATLIALITYYAVSVFTAMFTTPLIRALFYVGLIATYVTHILIIPLLLIMSKIELPIKQLTKGAIFFVMGVLYTLVTWYIIPDFIELFFITLWNQPTLYGIFSTALILTYVLALIVIPNYLIFAKSEAGK